ARAGDRGRGVRCRRGARARAVPPAVDVSPQVVRVDAGAVALSCLVWADDGPTVLLLHGNGGHAHWWDALVPGPPPGWRLGAARVAGRRAGRGYATYEDAVAAFRFVPDESGVGAEIIANLAHHALRERGPGDWTFRFDRAVLALDGDGANDLAALLPRIRCPTLVLAGADSWVMDVAERAAIVAAIPGARVRVFPGGHHFFLAQPAAVAAELRRFLDG